MTPLPWLYNFFLLAIKQMMHRSEEMSSNRKPWSVNLNGTFATQQTFSKIILSPNFEYFPPKILRYFHFWESQSLGNRRHVNMIYQLGIS